MRITWVIGALMLMAGGCSGAGVDVYVSSASATAKDHVAGELGVNRDRLTVTMVPEFDGDCGVTVVDGPAGRTVVFMHWEGKHQFRVTDSGADLRPEWLTEDDPGCHHP